jgi:hypothetical protein
MPDITAIQQKLTEWFISSGPPTSVTLIPQAKVKTPGKGIRTVDGPARPEQFMKQIWTGGDGLQTAGLDGTNHRYDMVLVGLFDCEAEIGDVWYVGDQKYYIHSEYPFNGYERKFGLYSYGSKPSDV